MTREEAVFKLLSYQRNVGATLDDVWGSVAWRFKNKPTRKSLLKILRKLERDGELTTVGEKWFFTPVGYKRAKGEQQPAQWTDSDGLILLAALHSCRREGNDLDALISTVDYFNHGVPTREELHGSINRLIAGRLLKIKGGKFFVTERATELLEKVEATGRRSPLRQLDRLERLLDCPCCGVQLKVVRWRYMLDAETYDETVKAYMKRFRGGAEPN